MTLHLAACGSVVVYAVCVVVGLAHCLAVLPATYDRGSLFDDVVLDVAAYRE